MSSAQVRPFSIFFDDMQELERAIKDRDSDKIMEFMGVYYNIPGDPRFLHFGVGIDAIGMDGNISISGLFAMKGARTSDGECCDGECIVPVCPECRRPVNKRIRGFEGEEE